MRTQMRAARYHKIGEPFTVDQIERPDMVATFEPESAGMHTTDSVDYVVVLDGEIYLEPDDQQDRLLKAHDVVIQGSGRHAWPNRSDKPMSLLVALVGARRQSQ